MSKEYVYCGQHNAGTDIYESEAETRGYTRFNFAASVKGDPLPAEYSTNVKENIKFSNDVLDLMDKTKIDLETHGPAAGVTTKDWLAAIDAALSRLCRGVSFSDDGADKSGTTADKTSGNRDHTSDSEEAPDSEEDASEPRYPVSNIRRSTNHISIHFLRSLDAEIVIRDFMDNEYPSEGREGSEGRSLFEVALFKYGIRISRVKTRGAQEDVKRGGVKRISDSQRWKTALLVEDKSEATLEIIELLGGKLLDTQGNLFLLQKFNRDGENQDGTEKRKISSSVNLTGSTE